MAVQDEINSYKEQLGVDFDNNLYVALMLGAITKRHILVSSSDPSATEVELKTIIGHAWRLQVKVLRVGEGFETTGDDILNFFIDGAQNQSLNAIYVISGMDKLSNTMQSLILEIIRTKKIRYNEKTYFGSELFTVVGVLDDYNAKDKQLFRYLQDAFWFKQPHDPQANSISHLDLKNVESSAEMIRKFKTIGDSINSVVIVPEMKRYIYDIVIFIRTHRCVNTGLPGRCISELELLSKALCVLFNRGFVIPSIIKLASRKLLPLKIKMIKPEHEPSLQWGSDPELVNELMKRMTPQLIVEDVLTKVSPPV